ncbi:hypothetical protein [Halobellus ordinarius]|uniref:hypothetical protein n=1 Tax=Halobellus ordinarius TaxID=3075120 RepID=UPI002880BD7E|nr:hypothetical protein [Halobellus sp. ZY16]
MLSSNTIDLLGVVLPFIGTLILAALYWRMWKQQRKQTEFQALSYLPQMVIESEETEEMIRDMDSKNHWFVIRNSGDVPFVTSVSISLAPVEEINKDAELLNPSSTFDSIPDEHKFSDESWKNDSLFLNPGDNRKWRLNMFRQEGRSQYQSDELERMYFLRVDAELESTLNPSQENKITRLFTLFMRQPFNLVPTTFEEANRRVLEKGSLSQESNEMGSD